MSSPRPHQCGHLTSKAAGQEGLRRLEPESELWSFAQTWIRRFHATEDENAAEKLIYLWVTVNAWASMVVPNLNRNHEDTYLVLSMAADPRFQNRFFSLLQTNPVFADRTRNLIGLAPVFQVLCLRNLGIDSWNDKRESRPAFIARVRDTYRRKHRLGELSGLNFEPKCAISHLDKGEEVPADWPHVIHMIYQIRCNLFHGGKAYDSSRYQLFIRLAYSILWDMWCEEMPQYMHLRSAGSRRPTSGSLQAPNQLQDSLTGVKSSGASHQADTAWDRILVRSGFHAPPCSDGFDLTNENQENRRFLAKILKAIGLPESFNGRVFSPPVERFDESAWLDAVERLHRGVEGSASGFDNIELGIMDTYMAGIVRWLNALGLLTEYSCDGHGQKPPRLDVEDHRQAGIVDACLVAVSNGRWRYKDGVITKEAVDRNLRRQHSPDRYWLLDVAEALFRNREALQGLVKKMAEIGARNAGSHMERP